MIITLHNNETDRKVAFNTAWVASMSESPSGDLWVTFSGDPAGLVIQENSGQILKAFQLADMGSAPKEFDAKWHWNTVNE